MKNANPETSKGMSRSLFTIFLSLGSFFIIFYVYVAYIGIKNGGADGFGVIAMFFMFFIYLALLIIFLIALIISRKRNKIEIFKNIAIVAIILEIALIYGIFTIFQDTRDEITYNNLTKQECALADNAVSYNDCANMTTHCIGRCASTVNAKTGDLKGCINLSINYVKSGTKCLRESNPDIEWCKEGFTCVEKNVLTKDGKTKDSYWIGYKDGTYKCIISGVDSYCPYNN